MCKTIAIGATVALILSCGIVKAEQSQDCIFSSYESSVVQIIYTFNNSAGASHTLQETGFIISDEGFVISVLPHSIAPNEEVVVHLADPTSRPLTASIIGRDSDLVLLHIPRDASPWPSIPLGDSTVIRPGDKVSGLGFASGGPSLIPMSVVKAFLQKTFWQTNLTMGATENGAPIFGPTATVVGVAEPQVAGDSQPSGNVVPIQFATPLIAKAGVKAMPVGPCQSDKEAISSIRPNNVGSAAKGKERTKAVIMRVGVPPVPDAARRFEHWRSALAGKINEDISYVLSDEAISSSAKYLGDVEFSQMDATDHYTLNKMEDLWNKMGLFELVQGVPNVRNSELYMDTDVYLGALKGYLQTNDLFFLEEVSGRALVSEKNLLVYVTLYALIEDAIAKQKPDFLVCRLLSRAYSYKVDLETTGAVENANGKGSNSVTSEFGQKNVQLNAAISDALLKVSQEHSCALPG